MKKPLSHRAPTCHPPVTCPGPGLSPSGLTLYILRPSQNTFDFFILLQCLGPLGQ